MESWMRSSFFQSSLVLIMRDCGSIHLLSPFLLDLRYCDRSNAYIWFSFPIQLLFQKFLERLLILAVSSGVTSLATLIERHISLISTIRILAQLGSERSIAARFRVTSAVGVDFVNSHCILVVVGSSGAIPGIVGVVITSCSVMIDPFAITVRTLLGFLGTQSARLMILVSPRHSRGVGISAQSNARISTALLGTDR
uniref:Uncharacterized protein n=1 Tax=Physcomitrium patens TaxID=3218 RepID=A0A2K1ISE2_PHYPA|nr:hypothetical protein PHYPA_026303 [Physcomitrium patens]